MTVRVSFLAFDGIQANKVCFRHIFVMIIIYYFYFLMFFILIFRPTGSTFEKFSDQKQRN